MSRISFRLMTTAAAAVLVLIASPPAFSDSHVRIVRLSYVEGDVQIDRGSGYEKAMMNLPITEGTSIRSADDGRAEIELEDASAIRVTPRTEIRFPELSLRDTGAKLSTVEVVKGTAYLDFNRSKKDELNVLFGREKIALARSSRLRIGLNDSSAAVAVFKGDIQVEGPSGITQVKKNQTADFDLSANDLSANDQPVLAKNIEKQPYDNWDKQQSEFHSRYSGNSYNSYSPYAYGSSDLNYYGNFFDAPGYGTLWQPYFTDASWDPFMHGAWAFSPGFGYGWVSAYPWGWTPYHYGTWVFLPSYGWAWQPGGAWTGWYSQPRILNPPRGFAVPRAPSTGRTTLVVNRTAYSAPSVQSRNRLAIPNNSAGLGIRRGEINDLATVSRQIDQRPAAPRGGGTQRQGATAQFPSARGNAENGPSRASQPAPRGMSQSAPAPRSAPSSAPSHSGTGQAPHR